MRIAVIGTGNIGGTLGRAFATAGHEVTFGSRHPDDTAAADATTAGVTDVEAALEHADVVLLAIPGPTVGDFVDAQRDGLAGKLVVDAANVIGGSGPANSHDRIVGSVPGARYARAFNTLGWENFEDPHFGDQVADLFFSADDADVPTVVVLAEAVGLRPVHVGVGAHDVVDGLLPLWFALSRSHGRHLAFKMLEDQAG